MVTGDSPNSHVHDAAQTVWDSCTPYHNFGGVTPDPTYSITVNYEVDGAAVAAAPDGVVVTGAVADLANGTHVLNLLRLMNFPIHCVKDVGNMGRPTSFVKMRSSSAVPSPINRASADSIAAALGQKTTKLFEVTPHGEPLAPATIRSYH